MAAFAAMPFGGLGLVFARVSVDRAAGFHYFFALWVKGILGIVARAISLDGGSVPWLVWR